MSRIWKPLELLLYSRLHGRASECEFWAPVMQLSLRSTTMGFHTDDAASKFWRDARKELAHFFFQALALCWALFLAPRHPNFDAHLTVTRFAGKEPQHDMTCRLSLGQVRVMHQRSYQRAGQWCTNETNRNATEPLSFQSHQVNTFYMQIVHAKPHMFVGHHVEMCFFFLVIFGGKICSFQKVSHLENPQCITKIRRNENNESSSSTGSCSWRQFWLKSKLSFIFLELWTRINQEVFQVPHVKQLGPTQQHDGNYGEMISSLWKNWVENHRGDRGRGSELVSELLRQWTYESIDWPWTWCRESYKTPTGEVVFMGETSRLFDVSVNCCGSTSTHGL